ncbi:LysM peptidoglycan-binding domain-containing protein, partial [Pseudofulvimonas gallinarii]|uniref:LysM peptidoglycan-binding domain-containing protein n=1 Tax=Pseudofulvimonas gallinarii TaxID=634155 RepID=UPI00197EC869
MARRLAGMIAVTLLLSGCIVTRTEVVRVRHAGDSASPAGGQGTSTASAAGTHVVSRGDTLYSIAFRAGVDWRDVAAINGLAPPYTIYPGQRLRLSRGGVNWIQQAKLVAGDPQAYDVFGLSVALDGDTVLVGAYGEDD